MTEEERTVFFIQTNNRQSNLSSETGATLQGERAEVDTHNHTLSPVG